MLLVDPATSAGGMAKRHAREASADGLNPQTVDAVCATHAHPDHVRGVRFFQALVERAGRVTPPFFAHEAAIPSLVDLSAAKRSVEESMVLRLPNGELWDLRRELGVPPTGAVLLGFRYLLGKQRPPKDPRGLPDAPTKLPFDRCDVVAVPTPGHSPDHVTYVVDGDLAICGDLVSFREHAGKALPLASINNPASDVDQELASIRRLVDLEPSALLTGHYGAWEGRELVERYLHEAHAMLEAMVDEVRNIVSSEPGVHTVRSLAARAIRWDQYLAGVKTRECSTFVVLKKLAAEGFVTPRRRGKEVVWK
ncbi:MAG: hypothetical protein Kow0069_06150 [Promethearchaeota archaeon]